MNLNMKILTVTALFAIASLAMAAGGGMGGKGKRAAGAQQPMPNLMRIVKKQGDQLNLDEQQTAQLASWREKSHGVVHAKLDEMAAIRKQLQNAVIDGASRAQINGYLARIDSLRNEIVAIKLRCRNNMRDILNDEQWQKVTALYRERFM